MFTGALRLFRAFGIGVFLHWSWALIAFYAISQRWHSYHSFVWPVLEVLSLFGIVLMHEFGHALACRSVGGKADTIILWPFGGIAFVDPPMRPGAWLWSLFAGPLVNIILAPITFLAWYLVTSHYADVPYSQVPDFARYVTALFATNTALLVFNLLPIYPLDGGQILQSLLWFPLGFIRSLRIAAILGILGAIGLVVVSIYLQLGGWLIILSVFVGMQAFNGLQRAQALAEMARHPGPPMPPGFPPQTVESYRPEPEQPRTPAPVPPPLPPAEAPMPPGTGELRPPRW